MSIIPDEDDQTINYTPFNQVKDISEANFSLAFTYGADHQRRKTVLTDGGSIIKTKYFLGAYEEEITVANGTRKIHYISGGDGLAAVYIIEDGNTSGDFNYTYTDHLGSIVAIEDKDGLIHEQSFDPWGRRRNPVDWDDYMSIPAFSLLDRGYTGHEHLGEFAIINMNGRLYDPVLGRMLSPDPFIQIPDYTQNYNRYSYGFNNPLIHTDPDGEFIQYIVGGILGGLAGNSIANAKGATGLAKFGYILGGAAIGAATGGISAHIAASGGFMANTASIFFGTTFNSIGMNGLSGGLTDVNMGFGAFSYNVSQNSFGHLGKPGNSAMQNIGYFFGAAVNISDIMAGFNGTSGTVHTNIEDASGHSAFTGGDKVENGELTNEIEISVGPGTTDGGKRYASYNDTYAISTSKHPSINLNLHNLKKSKLIEMTNNLNTKAKDIIHSSKGLGLSLEGVPADELKSWIAGPAYYNLRGSGLARYSTIGNSCVSYVSRALWYSGVPNVGIHPFFLHASLGLRHSALYNNSFYIGF